MVLLKPRQPLLCTPSLWARSSSASLIVCRLVVARQAVHFTGGLHLLSRAALLTAHHLLVRTAATCCWGVTVPPSCLTWALPALSPRPWPPAPALAAPLAPGPGAPPRCCLPRAAQTAATSSPSGSACGRCAQVSTSSLELPHVSGCGTCLGQRIQFLQRSPSWASLQDLREGSTAGQLTGNRPENRGGQGVQKYLTATVSAPRPTAQ